MASPSPRWLKAAEAQADLLVENFEVDLRGIARSIARHQNAEAVLMNHVDEAFDCLARAGLKRLVWWQRTELEVGVGSFLFALALASPDVLGAWFPDAGGIIRAAMAALAILGVGVCLHGWFRGRL